MTFPCKEELIEFERMDKLQKRIYPDACDYGIPLGDLLPATLEQMRVNLNEMLTVFKKPEYLYQASNWHNGRDVSFFIPIEDDRGISVRIAFHRDPQVSGGGFIQIDLGNTVRSKVNR